MGRTVDEVIDALPKEQRERVLARYRELKTEVESLRELRRTSGRAQTEVADKLGVKQPSVSKLEKQADMYLSTLRSYIKAIGGDLELIVRLPSRAPMRLKHLGEVVRVASNRKRKSAKSAPAKRRRA
jgi:DNA-binding XRE family transcriptional regulator